MATSGRIERLVACAARGARAIGVRGKVGERRTRGEICGEMCGEICEEMRGEMEGLHVYLLHEATCAVDVGRRLADHRVHHSRHRRGIHSDPNEIEPL